MAAQYFKLKKKSNVVIKTNEVSKKGFVLIVYNNHKGMEQITEEVLEKDFDICTKEYFETHKDTYKDRK